ncbi:hypothetical protein JKP88DRAFT_272846 [Tribonema minus]|uniref:Uncharacterized protein n=1 Tax=Tribonema minus TaxID=303371 RepID=A0A835YY60_9STRA|nr:hypothetical protein JKP88DRAFT_272846 [Tribonema minus]
MSSTAQSAVESLPTLVFAFCNLHDVAWKARFTKQLVEAMRWRLGVPADLGIVFADAHPLTEPVADSSGHLLPWKDVRTVVDILRFATVTTSEASDFARLVRSKKTVYMRPFAMLSLPAWSSGEQSLMEAMQPVPGVLHIRVHDAFASAFAFRARESIVFEADETIAMRLPADLNALSVEVVGNPRFLDLSLLPEAIGPLPRHARINLRATEMALDWEMLLEAAEKRLLAMYDGTGWYLSPERATVLHIALQSAPAFAEAADARGYTQVYPPGYTLCFPARGQVQIDVFDAVTVLSARLLCRA